MRASTTVSVKRQPRGGTTGKGWLLPLTIALALALLALAPLPARAAGSASGRSLGVTLSYPDNGLNLGEQLCLAIFPGTASDFSAPPLQSRCLDPGQDSATFEAIGAGSYQVVVPGPGSSATTSRYQGQLVATDVPDDPNVGGYDIPITLQLSPQAAGVTGSIQVNVSVCPPGTNGAGDATLWADKCSARAGGIPLNLAGVGNIENTSIPAITGLEGDSAGKVEFTNVPAGTYQLESDLPANVADTPKLFITSNIDGSIAPLDLNQPVSVRPGETAVIDAYLVLDQSAGASGSGIAETDNAGSANPGIDAAPAPSGPVGTDLTVSGGLSPDAAARMAEEHKDK